MSIAQDIIEERSVSVQLVKGTNTDNEPFFAYMLLKANTLLDFEEVLKSETTDLKEHGVILASGEGHVPPEELHHFMLNMVNAEGSA